VLSLFNTDGVDDAVEASKFKNTLIAAYTAFEADIASLHLVVR
jgi:hypothetical protein